MPNLVEPQGDGRLKKECTPLHHPQKVSFILIHLGDRTVEPPPTRKYTILSPVPQKLPAKRERQRPRSQ